jgi:hypothetical protein
VTGAGGVTSASFTPSQRGVYSVIASFAGDSGDASVTSTALVISVYQEVQLSVQDVNAVAGTTAFVSASLVTVPGGQPVEGETVSISPGGGLPSCSAITNTAGVATCPVTYPAAGSFTAQASFRHLANFFANPDGSLQTQIATAPVDVASAPTFISALSGPATTNVGETVSVSATLSGLGGGGLAGEPVVFAITDPSGDVTDISSETAADGQALTSFTPAEQGVYTVVASFAGNAGDAAVTSTTLSIPVYQSTMLSMPNVTAVAGTPTAVSATLVTVPSDTPLAGQTVSISPGGGLPPCSATTNTAGVASCTVTYPAAGSFTAQATFSNPTGFFANALGEPNTADVATAPADVTAATPTITTIQQPATAPVGSSIADKATVSGGDSPTGTVTFNL